MKILIIINLLFILAFIIMTFIAKEDKQLGDNKINNKYKIERKNLDTGNIDMIFEVDALTSDVKIVEVKPNRSISGGGSGNE
ncbi:MAG: hypothetical protein PHH51_01415 [Bacilli bacterium]|nr:hypothetical protein [Bacilli bacterium]MDD3895695.1 hypothetical protein [Bacilli bacterium]